jgi:molybdenum cofactor cytidylyltransferase
VLQRLLADMQVTKAEIQAMGVGGLLMEIITRPQPRAPGLVNHAQVAAVVLAAGQSTRMGSNKLLKMVGGKPMVRHVAEAALASRAGPVFVVVGHQASDVSLALAGLNVTFVHNPDYAQGLSSSLKTGIAAVPDTSAGALVLLGDMPRITPEIINRLVIALDTNGTASAVVPTVAGQRGNPILLGRALFPQVADLNGDIGARRLIDQSADKIVEIPIDDAAVLLDVDTPDALKALEALG